MTTQILNAPTTAQFQTAPGEVPVLGSGGGLGSGSGTILVGGGAHNPGPPPPGHFGRIHGKR